MKKTLRIFLKKMFSKKILFWIFGKVGIIFPSAKFCVEHDFECFSQRYWQKKALEFCGDFVVGARWCHLVAKQRSMLLGCQCWRYVNFPAWHFDIFDIVTFWYFDNELILEILYFDDRVRAFYNNMPSLRFFKAN